MGQFQLAQEKVVAYYDNLAEEMLKVIDHEKEESLAILRALEGENARLN